MSPTQRAKSLPEPVEELPTLKKILPHFISTLQMSARWTGHFFRAQKGQFLKAPRHIL